MKTALIIALALVVMPVTGFAQLPPPPAPDVLLPAIYPAGMAAMIQPRYVHGNTNKIAATWTFTNSHEVVVEEPMMSADSNGVPNVWFKVMTNYSHVDGIVTWPATVTHSAVGGTNGNWIKYDLAPARRCLDSIFLITNLYTTTDGVAWVPVGWHSGSGEPFRMFKVSGPLGFCQMTVTN